MFYHIAEKLYDMKVFFSLVLLFGALFALGQCTFPEVYQGKNVKEVIAYKGKVYCNLKETGWVELVDSSDKYRIISYEKTGTETFAKVVCGAMVKVETVMPAYLTKVPSTINPGIYLKKSGGLILGGFAVSGAFTTIGYFVIKKSDDPKIGVTIMGIGGGSGAILTLAGVGMLIKAGNSFIRYKSKREMLQLHYYGTSASLRLRF